jgi:hypothetical protein
MIIFPLCRLPRGFEPNKLLLEFLGTVELARRFPTALLLCQKFLNHENLLRPNWYAELYGIRKAA